MALLDDSMREKSRGRGPSTRRLWRALFLLGLGAGSLAYAPPVVPDQYFASTTLQFSKREYAQRRERFCSLIGEGLVLIPSADYPVGLETFRQDSTFLYLTGLEVPRSCLLFDAATRREILYLPARDERFYQAGRETSLRRGRVLYPDQEILSRSGLREIAPFTQLERDLENSLRGQKTVWIDLGPGDEWAHKDTPFGFPPGRESYLYAQLQHRFSAVRLRNLYPALASLRVIKSEAELKVMRRVAALSATGLTRALARVQPNMYERTLEAVLTFAFKKEGAQRFPAGLTARSGPNAVLPAAVLAANYDRRNRPMQAGELVIADASCEFNYYTAAITRTVPVSGQFTEEQRDVYRAVLAASNAAIAAIRPGVTLKQVEEAALAALPLRYRRWWEPGIVHFIGLDVIDPGDTARPLAPGMTLTIEPRLHTSERNLGVMVGDVVLVTPTGGEVLTADAPKDPARLEELTHRRHPPRIPQ